MISLLPNIPYYYETLLSQSVQDGIPFPDFSNQISSAQVGTMCPGDPLRQKKDEGIGLVTIFTRAAIQGEFHLRKLTPAAITISSRLKLQATLQKSYS